MSQAKVPSHLFIIAFRLPLLALFLARWPVGLVLFVAAVHYFAKWRIDGREDQTRPLEDARRLLETRTPSLTKCADQEGFKAVWTLTP